MRFLLVLVFLATACRGKDVILDTGEVDSSSETGETDETGETGDPVVDADGDGHDADSDCDDADASAYPGAEEVCDDVDNDCDGEVDEDTTTDFWVDSDGDGFGDDTQPAVEGCELPVGYSATGGDCDDADPGFHPGATENDCTDPADYNCDGSVGYADEDADGHPACEDCDDAEAAVNEEAPETCNGVDDNCDGSIDEDATDAATWYGDADGDGYGGGQFLLESCEAPAGYVATSDDCNDLDPATHPGASEVCDAADNDCDSQVDEGVELSFYADSDGDGYGDATTTGQGCSLPPGYSWNGDDCDDSDPSARPGGVEVCDGADNDCNGTADDNPVNGSSWYADADADGYGDAASTSVACSAPSGTVADNTDCDDLQTSINPAASETCNGLDDNCDGATDEVSAVDATTWYLDGDGDGYGDPGDSASSCTQPTSRVADATDCDDNAAAVNPGAAEVCDASDTDEDCSGAADDSDPNASGTTTWYTDADGDGQGDDSDPGVDYCDPQSGLSATQGDCNDSDAQAYADSNGICGLGPSCAAILASGAGTTDGVYTLDPGGPDSGDAPLFNFCDMTTDGGGWTLVWKHAYYEVGTPTNAMRFYASTLTPWTSAGDSSWCNVPNKTSIGVVEQRTHATHNGTTVWDFKGDLNPDLDLDWTGAILQNPVELTDLCSSSSNANPEPESGGHAYLGLTFDKANNGDYTSNCDTDRYGSNTDISSDCRWENCTLPGSISSSANHTQMTVQIYVR